MKPIKAFAIALIVVLIGWKALDWLVSLSYDDWRGLAEPVAYLLQWANVFSSIVLAIATWYFALEMIRFRRSLQMMNRANQDLARATSLLAQTAHEALDKGT